MSTDDVKSYVSIDEYVASDKDAAAILAADKGSDASKALIVVVTNALREVSKVVNIVIAYSVLTFYNTGHHFDQKTDGRNFKSICKSMGITEFFNDIDPAELLHTAVHPFGVARPMWYLLSMKVNRKLSD